jgi:hypothetical protein
MPYLAPNCFTVNTALNRFTPAPVVATPQNIAATLQSNGLPSAAERISATHIRSNNRIND